MPDISNYESSLFEIISKKFLVIGGAGIGSAVVRELLKEMHSYLMSSNSENNLVELVRGLRSSIDAMKVNSELRIDCGSPEFSSFMKANKYDYVLNLSALKHVRSERSLYFNAHD